MSKAIQLKDIKTDSSVYPITMAQLVYTSDGSTAEYLLSGIQNYINDAVYDSSTHYINFKHGNNIIVQLDASDFIKDGMVSNVVIKNGTGPNEGKQCLVITFNNDAGKEDIEIPLENIFNPNNYYTKSQSDSTFIKGVKLNSETLNPDNGIVTINIPLWALNQNKPSYTASEVGALPSSTKYGSSIDASLSFENQTFSLFLKDQNGTNLNTVNVDFPVETSPIKDSINPVSSGALYNAINFDYESWEITFDNSTGLLQAIYKK